MDIAALWKPAIDNAHSPLMRSDNNLLQQNRARRRHSILRRVSLSDSLNAREVSGGNVKPDRQYSPEPIQNATGELPDNDNQASKKLVLPEGVCHYSERAWLDPDIKKIRHTYVSNGIFFPKYKEGLKSYCLKNWTHAKQCFELVLTQQEDRPSRHFLRKITEHGSVPPRNFVGYTMERWTWEVTYQVIVIFLIPTFKTSSHCQVCDYV